jgi:hypothetical protein
MTQDKRREIEQTFFKTNHQLGSGLQYKQVQDHGNNPKRPKNCHVAFRAL